MKASFRARSCLLLFLAAACSEPAAPSDRAGIRVYAGGDQYGTPGAEVAEPLQVIVTDGARRPRSNITVRWRVTRGNGATVNTATSSTGSNGVATTSLRLGPDTGRYEVQATIENMTGEAARFEIRSVQRPAITVITPASVAVRDTVTITGSHFSTQAQENTVLFDGIPGQVISATSTQLRVAVPPCLPTRQVEVRAAFRSVSSNPQPVSVNGNNAANLSLQPGQAARITSVSELACQRLPEQAGAGYLIIPQNVSALAGTITPFEARGLKSGGPLVTFAPTLDAQSRSFAEEWEARLRASERAFVRRAGAEDFARVQAYPAAVPQIGERRSFKVLNKDSRFSDVEAEVRHISDRAIIYIDRNAPQNGLTAADLQNIGSSFDSPIWTVDVERFGNPSDMDANGKIIILLTPVVNELTPAGASSFIGGFFYACDLMSRSRCAGSNSGEIFYLLVPDPEGRHGSARTRGTVMSAILPILAHEFQHMINYSVRGSLDALWLAEGLAHMAEDLVADAYANAGDVETARVYRGPNYNRAAFFMRDTANSLVSEELPGSVEQRGAAWLLLKYLQGHYGNGIFRTMTSSQRSSADNVSTAIGKMWSELLSEWAIALWADNAPQFPDGSINARYTFPNIDLRRDVTGGLAYPLNVTSTSFSDFVVRGGLRASAQRFIYVEAASGSTPSPLGVGVTGAHGGAFAADSEVQLTILRVK